jgi:hypothetical protein
MENSTNSPSHKIFSVRDRGEGKNPEGGRKKRGSQWTEVGVGFTNRDGSINLIFNALPLSGKVQVRINEQQKAE